METRFSICEIVEMGIQIEKNGHEFYSVLAESCEDKAVAAVFGYLAVEETAHIRFFEDLFKETCKYEPEGAYPEEYFSFMRALAGQYVFTKIGQGKKMASGIKDMPEAIDMGIKFEKDSILFYSEMKKSMSAKDEALVEKIIQEERNHLIKLCDIKGGTSSEECNCI